MQAGADLPLVRVAYDKEPSRTVEWDGSQAEVKMPCIAGIMHDEGRLETCVLTRKGLGKEKVLRAGTHAFVKMPGEEFLRIGVVATSWGQACGHPHLSSGAAVVFAGLNEPSCPPCYSPYSFFPPRRENNCSGRWNSSIDLR